MTSTTNVQLDKLLQGHKDLQKYLFVRGFLFTNRDDLDLNKFPFYGNWTKEAMGNGYFAYVHCMQKGYWVEKDENIFFLFGHAYNCFTMQYDENVILQRIADSYGTDEYQDCIDEITGLFVCGVIKKDLVEFIVDPAGMQSACYGAIDGNFYISSHPQLIGDICNLTRGDLVNELIDYKWYYRVMGPYLPADMTPFDEVKRIVPNIGYTFKAGKISHKRFYPLRDLAECKNDEEYNEVIKQSAEILKKNMELVLKKWDNAQISLSGGIDSNTTFAAGNGMYDKVKSFSFVSAEKESIDAEAAKVIAGKFNVDHSEYIIPSTSDNLKNYNEIVEIIDHNNGYVAKGRENEYRKRVFLMENLTAEAEIKSWVSETIRCYWYKHYGRKKMPKLSPKLYRNLYKIFIFNRGLAHKVDNVFEKYLDEFEYYSIPAQYPPADIHFNEVTWGSWGGLNISEMKIYSDIIIIFNNRKLLDLLFKVPMDKRISDQHHLDMKKYLNKELYDMNIRVVNMHETKFRAFMLNIIFTINSILPF
ncbi:MAG: asparagine synthase-related protein [Acutalibacteraceae bacterium]|nr:asparagine synthase-related protein [Acutalibacteraceae bacterium]